ncbi:GNAT family N-acetyltransferase [Microbacterium sp. SD291]|uniref:GNAT family N-acetyltransferase n=1 Tax=Microbacterium sp. SD291 TaxID=2782007 RepID=UPI001A959BDE|nr:GNAT family N-acetyltransferase [Microbacterium sp. SD291]
MFAPAYPIRTDRLLLRPLTPEDAEPMHAYKSDAESVRYVPYGRLTLADIEERIATRWATTRFEKQDDAVCLAVQERETGRLVGDVVLFWRSEDGWASGRRLVSWRASGSRGSGRRC